MTAITMKQLLEAGMHFGHQMHRWHPKMKKYLFGTRNKELVELTAARVVLLTLILDGRTVAAGIAAAVELLSEVKPEQIERFLLQLLSLGLCQQRTMCAPANHYTPRSDRDCRKPNRSMESVK